MDWNINSLDKINKQCGYCKLQTSNNKADLLVKIIYVTESHQIYFNQQKRVPTFTPLKHYVKKYSL